MAAIKVFAQLACILFMNLNAFLIDRHSDLVNVGGIARWQIVVFPRESKCLWDLCSDIWLALTISNGDFLSTPIALKTIFFSSQVIFSHI